jgi:hypothetical protein
MADSRTTKISIGDVLNIRRNLKGSPEAYGILLFNILLLAFVIFFETDRYLVVAAYFLETLIIGVFNVFKMLIIAFFSPEKDKTPDSKPFLVTNKDFSSSGSSNIFLIIFFIFHFGFFYMVQLTFLAGMADISGRRIAGSSGFFPNPVTFFKSALGEQGAYILLSILLVQLFILVYSFLIKKEYRVMNCTTQGMQPYGRIIVQQMVVLIGSFFIIIVRDPAVLSILLIVIKTFIDIYAQKKFDVNMLRQIQDKMSSDTNP